jgi:hypothetical protein
MAGICYQKSRPKIDPTADLARLAIAGMAFLVGAWLRSQSEDLIRGFGNKTPPDEFTIGWDNRGDGLISLF